MNENIRKDHLLNAGVSFRHVELDAYVGYTSKSCMDYSPIHPPVLQSDIPSIKEVIQEKPSSS